MIRKNSILSALALFSSFSTLFCCALPALFVSLGAGAALIGLLNAVPQLIWLSEHKLALFIFAGTMLASSGITRYTNRNAPCPAEPLKAESCKKLRNISGGVFVFSVVIYVIGFYFAFIAQYLGRFHG